MSIKSTWAEALRALIFDGYNPVGRGTCEPSVLAALRRRGLVHRKGANVTVTDAGVSALHADGYAIFLVTFCSLLDTGDPCPYFSREVAAKDMESARVFADAWAAHCGDCAVENVEQTFAKEEVV